MTSTNHEEPALSYDAHFLPNMEECEAIAGPAAEWPGNCYAVVSALLNAGVMPEGTKLCYGHWLGPVAEGSRFYGNALVRHGWLELPDGRIYDPTRYVFENDYPYIYFGWGNPEWYDNGGNRVREFLMGQVPPPPYNPTDVQVPMELTPNNLEWLMHIFQPQAFAVGFEDGDVWISMGQAMWLANLPLPKFEGHAKAIYQALVWGGQRALIPYDNRKAVMGE